MNDGEAVNFCGRNKHEEPVAHLEADWGHDKVLTGAWDATLKLWSTWDGKCLETFDCKFGRVRALVADLGKMRALCGTSDGFLKLLDIQGDKVKVLKGQSGHTSSVNALQATL